MLLLKRFPDQRNARPGVRMTRQEFMQWLKNVDLNGDGLISKEELMNALKALGLSWTWWKARRALARADLDKNGYINGSKEEEALADFFTEQWGIVFT
ncbi:hypothetical protein J5N97_016928 [Dioscorea zingiberensis]|uniref:EF-hand domain-containing protein n=1 Tax=Dioscorea zingiberensis TaxID=325984 RepID=A0A9D5CM93_9LILI|nr:hypothetical protein J5N97_016928 [Dioscorea zingiberensis]